MTPIRIPGDSVMSVSSRSLEPISAATPPVIARPTNIHPNTLVMKFESGVATAVAG